MVQKLISFTDVFADKRSDDPRSSKIQNNLLTSAFMEAFLDRGSSPAKTPAEHACPVYIQGLKYV
jgi:hypothetical protein